ncbi:MAG: hypothetical protein P0S95_04825 [Rhabdochlamydiaceae bacterium]|nr:hypothetical protein [Candidatus Amphrikana amoebophyrae]
MNERILQLFRKNVVLNTAQHQKAIKKLSNNAICYVLISCSEPQNDGKMQVEMSYEGDRVLASYLVKTALKILES